jgi:hypothetical protein
MGIKKAADKLGKTEDNLPVPHEPRENLPALSNSRGFEEPIDLEDLIIPRAKLLQPTSDELKDPTTELRQGQIINSLTKEILPACFVPVFYFKEYLRFNGRKKEDPGYDDNFAPGALMWRTRDAADERVAQCEFGPNGEVPLAITTLNFFSVFDGLSMPIIVSFGKTSYKAGKNLLSLAKLRGGDMFSRRYKISVLPGKNEKGSYFVFKINPNGDCDPELFKTVENYFIQYAMKRDTLKTHVEDELGL